MVAALLQVHHDVEQRHLVPTPLGVQRLKVPREDELVVLPVTEQEGKAVCMHLAMPASERTLCSAGRLGAGSQAQLQRDQGEPQEVKPQA